MRAFIYLNLILVLLSGCTKPEPKRVTDLVAPPFESEFEGVYIFPAPTKVNPCDGIEVLTGSLNKCVSKKNGIEVAFTSCAGLLPETIVHSSPAGTASNIPMYCSGDLCGQKTMVCQEGKTSGPFSILCATGYHDNGMGNCEANSQLCSVSELSSTGAISGTKTWNGIAYNACSPTKCVPGRFLDIDGSSNTVCSEVGFGYYSNSQSQRVQCPANSYTISTNSASLSDCLCNRHFVKNDNLCIAQASEAPVLNSTTPVLDAVLSGEIYYDSDSFFTLKFTPRASQRYIDVFSDSSCGTVTPRIARLDLDLGLDFIEIRNLPSGSVLHLRSENEAGSRSSCVEFKQFITDSEGPSLAFNGPLFDGTGVLNFLDIGVGLAPISTSSVTYTATPKDSNIIQYLSGSPIATTSILYPLNSTMNLNVGVPTFLGGIDVAINSPSGSVRDRLNNPSPEFSQTLPFTGYGAKKVVAGFNFTCALLNNGDVMCLGDNGAGQIDPDSTDLRFNRLRKVNAPRAAIDLAAGKEHLCVLMVGSEVYCQGNNSKFQLLTGSGTSGNALDKKSLYAKSNILSIHAGGDVTCTIELDSSLKVAMCKGSNENYQRGKSAPDYTSPLQSGGVDITGVESIAISDRNICVLVDNVSSKRILCSGDNSSGQLGRGIVQDLPTLVSSNDHGEFRNIFTSGSLILQDPRGIFAGYDTFCTTVGSPLKKLACWGKEPRDGFDFDSVLDESFPYVTEILKNTSERAQWSTDNVNSVSIAPEGRSICIETDVRDVCWGSTFSSGSGTDGSSTASQINGTIDGNGNLVDIRNIALPSVKAVSSSRGVNCAITNEESLYCWGSKPSYWDNDEPSFIPPYCASSAINACSIPTPPRM